MSSLSSGRPKLVQPRNLKTSKLSVNEVNALNEISDPQKQHEIIDAHRSTDGIDYEQVRKDAVALIDLRKQLQRKKRIADYRKIAKEKYPDFIKKFPNFFDSIRTVEIERLNEFTSVMHMMLSKMSDVKNDILTHTEMRNQIFENDLAERYYKRNAA
jgi:hypothetical protein